MQVIDRTPWLSSRTTPPPPPPPPRVASRGGCHCCAEDSSNAVYDQVYDQTPTMATARRGMTFVTALMTPGSCVNAAGIALRATRKTAPSAAPGATPSCRMRNRTSRAVDRSFCGKDVGRGCVLEDTRRRQDAAQAVTESACLQTSISLHALMQCGFKSAEEGASQTGNRADVSRRYAGHAPLPGLKQPWSWR